MSRLFIITSLLHLLRLCNGLMADESFAATRNHSAVASSTAMSSGLQPYPNSTEAKDQSYGEIGDVYAAPPGSERGPCSITDEYCTYNGTDRNPDGLSDQCMLWDNTCSGNETLAMDRFFGQTQQFLYDNVCFTGDGEGVVESNCTQQNRPARFSEFTRIKSWMRSSQCIASQGLYQKAHPAPDTEGMQGEKRSYEKRSNSTQGRIIGGGTCCGVCNINAGNVDVYYWPVANANTSCLSIIGNSVNPPDYGATTDSLGLKYWGCTKPLTGIPGESVQTITTASVMITGSMSWKAYLENPWSSPLCPTTSSASPSHNASVNVRDIDGQIYARGHTLVVPASVTGKDGLPITTVVSGGFTFTSPSVYAGFTDIGAYDSCGGEIISTTMLSFAPGELSTVVGPRYGDIAATTQPFDFADLPCPPYSVAFTNYYKPEPGEPYRPLIAIPSQVRKMAPWFQYCQDLWFTGFDPPRTLVPAEAMAPAVTSTDPADPVTVAPMPSATQDPGARRTAAVWNPIPLPSPFKHAALPTETKLVPEPKPQVPKPTDQVPVIEPQVPQPQPGGGNPGTKHQDPSPQSSSSIDPNGDSSVQPGSDGDPKSPGNSKQKGSTDPSSLAHISGHSSPQDTAKPTQNDPQNQVSDPENPTRTHTTQSSATTISVNGHAVVAGPSGVHIDGVKVDPSAAPVSVSGVAVINGGNSIVVASHIFQLPTPTEQAATTIAGQKITPLSIGALVQGKTITFGAAPTIISGTSVSVDHSHIYFGSSSYLLPTAAPIPVTTLANGAVALPLSNAVSIYGTTITAGAPPIAFSGTSVSLDRSSNIIFDGTAQALPSFPPTNPESGQVTTINGAAVQLLPGDVSVAGTTLTPEGPAVTASGTPISLGPNVLVVGSSSIPVSFGNPQSLITTVGGQAITAAATAVKIGTATLSPGAPGATVGGTLVSLGSSGNLVVGTKTVILAGPSGSLGGLIMGGFGNGGPSLNPSSPNGSVPTGSSNGTDSGVQTFKGRAERLTSLVPESVAGLAVAIYLMLCLYIYQ